MWACRNTLLGYLLEQFSCYRHQLVSHCSVLINLSFKAALSRNVRVRPLFTLSSPLRTICSVLFCSLGLVYLWMLESIWESFRPLSLTFMAGTSVCWLNLGDCWFYGDFESRIA
ncbi:hypothetical protein KSP40_PGU004660 [Platanthera guangdongensis]|uniref:Uncharacterized protein n=1 Tax=Platanthera guangdongensis TaxID=2320717 RepID=A0ABR2LGI9_9ASPA